MADEKKKKGCLTWLFYGFLILVGLGIIGDIIGGRESRTTVTPPSSQEIKSVEKDLPKIRRQEPTALDKLITARPEDVDPRTVDDAFRLGTKSTHIQRDKLEKAITGKIVLWKLKVYEVKKTGDREYTIQTIQGENCPVRCRSGCQEQGSPAQCEQSCMQFCTDVKSVATDSKITARSKSDVAYIEELKTDDYVTIKGKIDDISLRHIILKPAIVIPSNTPSQETNSEEKEPQEIPRHEPTAPDKVL
jgi:hypothetical protein